MFAVSFMKNIHINHKINANFKQINLLYLLPALLLLVLFFIYLLSINQDEKLGHTYIFFQKELFFNLNSFLSKYPILQFNLTQLGDVLISFSLLSLLLLYAPKLWEAMLTSSLLSLVITSLLKKLFSIPRPAATFDINHFVIVGRKLTGNTSLPSGHTIATFMVITILLFAFMPKKRSLKIIWFIFMLVLGNFIALSRVGVGAHYPFDVFIGSIIGYSIAILGIKISNHFTLFRWIENKKYYPIFIVLFLVSIWLIIGKLYKYNLFIFYTAIFSLIVTLIFIIIKYAKKD